MNTTTIHLKTKRELKHKVEKLADTLGLTLTSLINLSLSQLVHSSELVIDLRPQPNTKTLRQLLKRKKEAGAGKNLSPTFTDPKEALKWLHT